MEPEKSANPEGPPPEAPPPPSAPQPAEEGASQAPAPSAAAPPQPAEEQAAPERKPIDERTVALLRAAAHRRRPWTVGSCLLTLLLLAVPLGLLVWWLWPRSPPPRVGVIAFDQVAVQGGSVTCRAQVIPAEPVEPGAELSGHELRFALRLPGKNVPEKGAQQDAVTQADGSAAVNLVPPGQVSRLDLLVLPVADPKLRDRARIFAWPRQTRILLVEVAALPPTRDKLRPQAAQALHKAQTAKFAVGYVAIRAEGAVGYSKVRNELEAGTAGPGGIPDGPVLGRLSVGGNVTADGPAAVLAHLSGFGGPVVVLVHDREAEKAYRAAGARVLRVGQGGLAWGELAKELAK
jgi:hypothetical protein